MPTLYTIQHGAEIGSSPGQEPVTVEKIKAILKYQKAAFALALRHHLKIAFGLDDNPDFLPKGFAALVRGGMIPLQAIQAATVDASELLGLSAQIGTIEPGVFVMKGGEVIKRP